ncbi:histidine acid phosphatase [Tritrichomonas foetus]|uniref:Histidine acid phosphatase n=1 Tax=Tritrichomonas foetus TaxID=1144522 RepID=A0A1J4KJR8_9EUKA|nr:histidine acid phosphatase [Tritrichomonas foetus]|eukprot:OHT11475.1 histidine acid phosphatase [Tritrichomonas foetus]
MYGLLKTISTQKVTKFLMLLLFFFGLFQISWSSQDFKFECVAPLRTPPPIKNSKYLFAGVILRHGSRTPQHAYLPMSNRGYWVCDSDDAISPRMYSSLHSSHNSQSSHDSQSSHYSQSYRRFLKVIDPKLVEFLPNCRCGDLLIEGMEQHHRLGQLYHDYVYNTIKLFDEPPKTEEVYARSTDFERTFRSCQAFLHGAFPPQVPFEIFNIVHGSDFMEILRPGSFCKEQNSASDWFYSDPSVLEYAKEQWKKIEHISKSLQLTFSVQNLSLLADWVYTYNCNNKQLPSFVTDNDIYTCHSILAKLFARFFDGNGTAFASYSMREVMRVAKNSVNGEMKAKFGVFSAHDSTVLSFLSYLDVKIEMLPPYASHVLFEIFEIDKEAYIRWAFNGEVIMLNKFGGKDMMLFKTFLEKTKDVYDVCNELP